jgi:hypothetical protein
VSQGQRERESVCLFKRDKNRQRGRNGLTNVFCIYLCQRVRERERERIKKDRGRGGERVKQFVGNWLEKGLKKREQYIER